MAVEILNNFSKFKADFKQDTGFEFSQENMALYIAYYNARINDKAYQTIHTIAHQGLNKMDFLPDQISLRIAEMIKDNPLFKKLMNKP